MFKYLFFWFLFTFQMRKRLALRFQVFLILVSMPSHAFLSDILDTKKAVEGVILNLEVFTKSIEEAKSLMGTEEEYNSYEKELRQFQETLDEYEKLGIDVQDFIGFKNHNPSSLKEQIAFYKNYIKRANNLLQSIKNLIKSPETITASEQIETNRTLRALLEDNQTRELRKLRKEIASNKILLDRRKKEQEFINKQYAYINRHSKKKGFGLFHPFKNKNEFQNKKQKKFLGFF